MYLSFFFWWMKKSFVQVPYNKKKLYLCEYLNNTYYILVRFPVLVTTMVTKVDHGYYDGYFNGNTFFLQEYVFLDEFLRFSIIFDSFHTQ